MLKRLTPLLFVALISLSAAAQQLAAEPLAAEPLDLSRPEDAVKAMQKVQCYLEDGKDAVYWFQGNVFSRVPGERDRLLFTYDAFNIRACKALADPQKGYGYRMVSRELLLYLDPKTGEVMRTWKNPWTNEEVEIVHVANDPVNSRPTFAMGSHGPYELGATFKEGRGWFTFEVPLFYENVLGGPYQDYVGGTYQAMEIFSFFFDEARLKDPKISGLDDTHVAWTRVSKWLPWMKMNDRAGQLIFSGSGKRVDGFEALTDLLKKEVAATYPDYRSAPPLDDARPNETSWTYFKKLVDQKRADEAAKKAGQP